MWFSFRKQKTKFFGCFTWSQYARCEYTQKKKRDKENKRQLIEFDALSDDQTLIIISRQC